ncbi:MAG: hypothetical protein HQK58_10370 [Deltaproteobacteria bacterium]|nr:hypothetical protein [Deltaproteobacteria bacterium]
MSNLFEEISIEKDYIEKTLDVMREAIGRPEKTYVELAAIGASLHHCYSGMENILKRIFKARNLSVPTSSSSHKDLLDIANQHGIIAVHLIDPLSIHLTIRLIIHLTDLRPPLPIVAPPALIAVSEYDRLINGAWPGILVFAVNRPDFLCSNWFLVIGNIGVR